MTPDVNVVLLNLPTKEKEAITENEDESYTIVINSRLSYGAQLLAYQHAMCHVSNNDFEKSDVQRIKSIAHSTVIPDDDKRIPSERFLQRIKTLRAERKRIQRKLEQVESEMEVMRNMNNYSNWEIPSHQQWFG